MVESAADAGSGGALLVFVTLSVVAVAAILVIAARLRDPHEDAPPDVVYESGIAPSAPANRPQNAPYFLIAAFFVIFDMEAAILFGWAIAAREAGVVGLVEAAIFIGVLLAALVYLWADGALDFGPKPPAADAETPPPTGPSP